MNPDIDADLILRVRGGGELWQGAAPPPGEAVARAGFHALVLCAEELQPDPSEVPFRGISIVYAPNDDAPVLTAKQWATARQAGQTVAALVTRGRRVLVTCQAGLNRSGLVSALAVRELTGCSGLDAATLVQNRRRRALCNRHFVELLAKLPARAPSPSLNAALFRRRLGGR